MGAGMDGSTEIEAVGTAGAAHAGGLLADLVAEVPCLPGHAEAVAAHAGVPDRGHIAAAAVRPDGPCCRAARENGDEEGVGRRRPRCHFGERGVIRQQQQLLMRNPGEDDTLWLARRWAPPRCSEIEDRQGGCARTGVSVKV
jgi:hypothetical protein